MDQASLYFLMARILMTKFPSHDFEKRDMQIIEILSVIFVKNSVC